MFDTPKRQHPVAALTSVLRFGREMLIPLIAILLFGGDGPASFIFGFWPLLGLFTLISVAGIVNWFRFYYWIEDDVLRIEQGLLLRKKSYIPKYRIQVIDISQGIIQRWFGLVSLNVQTAGGDTPGAIIQALTREEALSMRKTLRKSDAPDADHEKTDTPEAPETVSYLSPKRLLAAAATSGGFGLFLTVLGTLYSQLSQVIDEDKLVETVERIPLGDQNTIVTILLALVITAWLMSFFSTILRFSNFRIRKMKNELIISRGLIEKKQITIPFDRLQAVRIIEGTLRQPFGFASIVADSAGYGEERGKTTELMPLLPKKEAEAFIDTFVPEYAIRPTETIHPPKRAIIRFMIQALIPAVLLSAGAIWLVPHGIFSLILLPAAIYLGYLQFRDSEVQLHAKYLFMQYRILAKTTVIIPKRRIQSALTNQNPIQRYRDMADFSVSIASSSTGATFTVKNLDLTDSTDLTFACNNRIEPAAFRELTQTGALLNRPQHDNELRPESG